MSNHPRVLRRVWPLAFCFGGVLTVAVSIFAMLVLPGCGHDQPAQHIAKPHEGKVIRVACPGEPALSMVKRYSRSWAAETGARVEVVGYPPAATNASPEADLWIIEPAVMPRWADASRLLPVPRDYTTGENGYDWGNVLSLYRDKLAVWDRTIYALPITGEALVCFYRDDLFQEPARREAFRRKYHRDLKAPATWNEFADIAEFFRDSTHSASLPSLPADDEALDRQFYAMAAPYARRAVAMDAPRPSEEELFSFHYDLGTGAPRIDSPGFVYALGLLQRLQPCRAGTANSPEETFRQGKAVLCIADATWVGRFQDAEAIRNRYAICTVPGSSRYFDYFDGAEQKVAEPNRIPYLGGGGLLGIVPKNSSQAGAAFELLAALGGPRTSSEMVMEPAWGADVFRESQLANRGAWDTFELTPARTNSLLDALRVTVQPSAINPVIRLRTPDERSYLQALMHEVRKALTERTIKPAAALAKAASRWRELDAKISPAERLRAYRLSLGLLADRGASR